MVAAGHTVCPYSNAVRGNARSPSRFARPDAAAGYAALEAIHCRASRVSTHRTSPAVTVRTMSATGPCPCLCRAAQTRDLCASLKTIGKEAPCSDSIRSGNCASERTRHDLRLEPSDAPIDIYNKHASATAIRKLNDQYVRTAIEMSRVPLPRQIRRTAQVSQTIAQAGPAGNDGGDDRRDQGKPGGPEYCGRIRHHGGATNGGRW